MSRRQIRAIETRYNGRRYRSRLEARWAVYFDFLDIPFEYEREGYTDGDVCYLPDFWLPTVGVRGNGSCYVEVKPAMYGDDDERKFRVCPEDLIIVIGEPPGYGCEGAYQLQWYDVGGDGNEFSDGRAEIEREQTWDNFMALMVCVDGHYKWEFTESNYTSCSDPCHLPCVCCHPSMDWMPDCYKSGDRETYWIRKLQDAAAAARSARF